MDTPISKKQQVPLRAAKTRDKSNCICKKLYPN